MARPLWDKRTPFWLALAFAAVGVFVVVIWWGERHLAQKEAVHREQQAALAKQVQDARAAAERAERSNEKWKAEQEEREKQTRGLLAKGKESLVQGQLTIVGLAYRKAADKLGRPPKTADELSPFLPTADGLVSPRDHQPFEVAWGTSLTPPGRLLAWEKTPWEDGGRIVLLFGAQPKRVKAEEFKTLSAIAEPGAAPNRRGMSAFPDS